MSFTCPRCSRTSHHPMDEDYGYCGNCHDFTGEPKKTPTPTSEAELQFWYDIRTGCDQMALAQWRAAHPVDESAIPTHGDLVIWLLDQLAGVNRYEKTKDGIIDWKMEAERANRLLDSYERKYNVEQIPCDVMLPPATVIRRGCDLGTLITGLKAREGRSSHETVFAEETEGGLRNAQEDVRQILDQLTAARLDRVDTALAKRVGDHIARDSEIKAKLTDWLADYPLDVFPEPDIDKARRLLEAGGLTLDAVAASNIRFVLKRVLEICDL